MLCTTDIVGLYPSIHYIEGLEAIRKALDTRKNPIVLTESLFRLERLTLTTTCLSLMVKCAD